MQSHRRGCWVFVPFRPVLSRSAPSSQVKGHEESQHMTPDSPDRRRVPYCSFVSLERLDGARDGIANVTRGSC